MLYAPAMNLVRQLTTAIFFIHALIGCCWHHEHVCLAATDASAGQEATVCEHSHGHSCHGGHDDVGGERSDEDSDHQHACQGDRCFFVRVEAAQPPVLALASAVIPEVVSPFEQPQAAGADWDFLSYGGTLEAPLRLHLLHQVLLI